MAPAGTITVRVVALAPVTTAFAAPKYTVLATAEALKPVPWIATVDETGPERGEKEDTTGWAKTVKEQNVQIESSALFKVRLKKPGFSGNFFIMVKAMD